MEEDPLVQAPASGPILWRCDKDGCGYTVKALSQPVPHEEHPDHHMREVRDTARGGPSA